MRKFCVVSPSFCALISYLRGYKQSKTKFEYLLKKMQRIAIQLIHKVSARKKNTSEERNKTSMMWPSQNFLLYIRKIIKMKVTGWINNFKKYFPPPPLGIYTTCTNYNNLISKKSKRF